MHSHGLTMCRNAGRTLPSLRSCIHAPIHPVAFARHAHVPQATVPQATLHHSLRSFSSDRANILVTNAITSVARRRTGGVVRAAFDGQVPYSGGEVCRSSLVQAETVYFIFQLDLDSQLQQCLNKEAYDVAQEIRSTRQRVDAALEQMKERKLENSGAPSAPIGLSEMDIATEGLRLRTEMQRAVEDERYSDAAKFRDELNQLEQRSKAAAAIAAEFTSTECPRLRLGQRVTHIKDGYRGVVVGWDASCCEVEEWMSANKVEDLSKGKRQYFYHLLVDTRDFQMELDQPPVAYVAEELLTAPELEDYDKCWKTEYGPEPLEHPYSYMLFLGQDARGDYLPCRQLRDKYNIQRRDVHPRTDENKDEDEDEPMEE